MLAASSVDHVVLELGVPDAIWYCISAAKQGVACKPLGSDHTIRSDAPRR